MNGLTQVCCLRFDNFLKPYFQLFISLSTAFLWGSRTEISSDGLSPSRRAMFLLSCSLQLYFLEVPASSLKVYCVKDNLSEGRSSLSLRRCKILCSSLEAFDSSFCNILIEIPTKFSQKFSYLFQCQFEMPFWSFWERVRTWDVDGNSKHGLKKNCHFAFCPALKYTQQNMYTTLCSSIQRWWSAQWLEAVFLCHVSRQAQHFISFQICWTSRIPGLNSWY